MLFGILGTEQEKEYKSMNQTDNYLEFLSEIYEIEDNFWKDYYEESEADLELFRQLVL